MLVRMILARWRLFSLRPCFPCSHYRVLLRHGWQWSPKFLIAWDFSVVLYLSLVFWLAGRADIVLISPPVQNARRWSLRNSRSDGRRGEEVLFGTSRLSCCGVAQMS